MNLDYLPRTGIQKLKIRLFDSNFSHALFVGNGDLLYESKYIEWVRDDSTQCDIAIYTDYHLNEIFNRKHNFKINIAWAIEPMAIFQHSYEFLKKHHNLFDFVLTYEKELLDLDGEFYLFNIGGTWLYEIDHHIYPKNKLISIIASAKNRTEGHKLRHEVIALFKEKIDLIMGFGYHRFQCKLEPLKDVMFSIVIENCKRDYYFTDKITDCFLTGTIPIYWGCPSIGDYFDMNGIITFDSVEELKSILESDLQMFYVSNKEFVIRNFFSAKRYMNAEDDLFTSILSSIIDSGKLYGEKEGLC